MQPASFRTLEVEEARPPWATGYPGLSKIKQQKKTCWYLNMAWRFNQSLCYFHRLKTRINWESKFMEVRNLYSIRSLQGHRGQSQWGVWDGATNIQGWWLPESNTRGCLEGVRPKNQSDIVPVLSSGPSTVDFHLRSHTLGPLLSLALATGMLQTQSKSVNCSTPGEPYLIKFFRMCRVKATPSVLLPVIYLSKCQRCGGVWAILWFWVFKVLKVHSFTYSPNAFLKPLLCIRI